MPDLGGPDTRTPETSLSPPRGSPAADEAARRFTQDQQARAEASCAELEARTRWATAYLERNLARNEENTGRLVAKLSVLLWWGLVLVALPPLAVAGMALYGLMTGGDTGWLSGLNLLRILPFEGPGISLLLFSRLWSNDIAHERGEHTTMVLRATSLAVTLQQQDPEQLRMLVKRFAETDRNPVLPAGKYTVEIERNRWFVRSIVDGLANFRRAGRRRPKNMAQSKAGRAKRAEAAATSKSATGL